MVPEGPLHLPPFPALVMERAPIQFVLDRYTIALAPSLGFLGGAAQGPVGRLMAVRGSGPVEGSDRELTAVTGAWQIRGALMLRDSATTETAIRRLAPGPAVLHVALVVLSACETNAGGLGGEGLLSLSRAFLPPPT